MTRALRKGDLISTFIQNESLMKQIFSIYRDVLIITDMEGNVKYTNHVALETLGYDENEILGMPLHIIFDENDKNILFNNLIFLAKNGKVFDDEVMLFKKNGVSFFAHLIVKPITNNGYKDDLILFCIRDIDRWKRIERELRRFHYEVLVKIANGIAHEIRNPLTAIGGFIQRLYRSCEKYYYNKKEYGFVQINLRRIENIIKKVDLFVRSRPPSLKECNLLELIVESFMFYMDEIKKKNINIEMDTKKIIIRVDPDLIKRVFYILIENSLDAIESNGTISVELKEDENYAEIIFKDSGKGISTKDLPYIFHPFFSTKAQGAGIDLAILKKIVEDHGGAVEVASSPEKGTVFRIMLPFERRRPIRVKRWEDG